jgi:hypothetical protein
MGLDMYLMARRYISPVFHKNDAELQKALVNLFPDMMNKQVEARYVTFEIGYWRKANQIHSWFVKNVQGGKDECQESEVSREQLKELLELCKAVKEKRNVRVAKSELPPQSGFFFGSTDIDEGYWQDIDRTIEIVEQALSLPDGLSGWDITYRASW